MHAQVLNHNGSVTGSKYIGKHCFSCGHEVPIYEITTSGALNQIIGHAMFLNSNYGDVYYRGINYLFDNVKPSLLRNRRVCNPTDLYTVISGVFNDEYLKESLKLLNVEDAKNISRRFNTKIVDRYNKYIIESVLQHYNGFTRFLDIVDNHWVAIWMGLQNFTRFGKSNIHCKAIERRLDSGYIYESANGEKQTPPYVYLLLLAFPSTNGNSIRGIYENNEFVTIDLRKALPSIFLRPHAQHALVARRRDDSNQFGNPEYYDLANQVVGIIRIRIDVAKEMVGTGLLMNQENLFPSPGLDQGYNNLLMRNDIFKNYYRIVLYY